MRLLLPYILHSYVRGDEQKRKRYNGVYMTLNERLKLYLMFLCSYIAQWKMERVFFSLLLIESLGFFEGPDELLHPISDEGEFRLLWLPLYMTCLAHTAHRNAPEQICSS